MISYWWNLNSTFHVPPRPVVREGGGGGGKECNFRTNRQGSSPERERGRRGKRDTGERQRLREDRIEAKKEIRKTAR